jgi:predicted Fe-Mo cluster-binding NifX family protein
VPRVLVTIRPDGTVVPGLGRAPLVAIATVQDGKVSGWQEHAVGWDAAHDEGTEGAHHARIARFLREHEVDVVVTGRAGAGMVRMLGTMGIRLVMDVEGDARAAAVQHATPSG